MLLKRDNRSFIFRYCEVGFRLTSDSWYTLIGVKHVGRLPYEVAFRRSASYRRTHHGT